MYIVTSDESIGSVMNNGFIIQVAHIYKELQDITQDGIVLKSSGHNTEKLLKWYKTNI